MRAARLSFENVVEFIAGNSKASHNAVYAGSVPYLMLAGNVVAGWQMARALLVAEDKLAKGEGDAETKFRVDDRIWHRTGDSGYLDERGRLWLLGRASARIADDRGELYPFAVECAARQIPGVRRAALAHQAGRRILLLEPEAGAPPPDVTSVRSSLAWAQLDEVRVWREIPMDRRHNAKVDYAALKRRL